MSSFLDPQAVNSYDVFTRDCLTYAVQYDQLEIMKFLLKNGADVNNVATGIQKKLIFFFRINLFIIMNFK